MVAEVDSIIKQVSQLRNQCAEQEIAVFKEAIEKRSVDKDYFVSYNNKVGGDPGPSPASRDFSKVTSPLEAQRGT